MRHRHPASDNGVVIKVDYAATLLAPVAPPPGYIAAAHRRDVTRTSVRDCHAVEVAPVLGGKFADERRPPQRDETMSIADGRKTTEQRIDEDDATVLKAVYVVNVEIAGRVRQAGNETRS